MLNVIVYGAFLREVKHLALDHAWVDAMVARWRHAANGAGDQATICGTGILQTCSEGADATKYALTILVIRLPRSTAGVEGDG
ncbi:MAG: hypothetical protein HY287_15885 [Planctomycetes bacterium]|nr:hypothetical protein [Planctomycetota bacterium]MBI3835807.1 hypothetical protein [Planctomycetota bacterium]